jgi:DNA polymerase subunit Cdc27
MVELEDFPPDPPLEDSQDTSIAVDSPVPAATDMTVNEEAPKRKRGKRKVLRKTTKRDEKGYLGIFTEINNILILVTKNEYVYESFSEDDDSDAPPKVAKTATNPVPDKKKGKANAAGQKSLMSFFGK